MALNDKLLKAEAAAGGLTPSEHFGVVLYEGDGSSSHSINGGKFGAAAYTANSGVVTLPDNVIDADNHSVSIWFYANNLTGEQHLMEFDETNRIIFRISSPNNNDWCYIGNSGYFDHGLRFNTGQWYHIVITFSNGNPFKIYRNGSLEYTGGNTNLFANNSNNDVGAGSSTGTANVEGKIDQLRIFHKELSASEVSTLYAETAATVESLSPLGNETVDTLQVLGDTSCTALYKFENNEDDKSGNFNGTGTEIQYAAGRYGQAASFSGADDCIINFGAGGIQATSAVSNSFSISWWMKTTTTTQQKALFNTYGNATGAFGFALEMKGSNGGQIKMFTNYGGTDVNSGFTSNTYNDGNWHNFVLVKDVSGSSMKLYADKEEVLNITISTSAHVGNPLVFGNYTDHPSATYKYTGLLDQARTFNKAISTSEIATLYEENSLAASYRFEGNSSDDTRNNDGTDSNVTYEFGLNFTPDFVWIKERSAAESHRLFDTTRGATKRLFSDNTNAESTASDSLTSFDTGGFTVGSSAAVNQDGQDYVAWAWKANGGTTSSNTDGTNTSTVQVNQDAGFSIVQGTASGGLNTVNSFGHGLGVKPDLIILKSKTSTDNWYVYHKSTGAGKRLDLNDSGSYSSTSQVWANTEPTTSVFSIKDGQAVNVGATFIAYAFAEVENFSKFGSYVGNGSTDGPIVETGFEPAFLIIKRTDTDPTSGGDTTWLMYDNKRSPVNPRKKRLWADNSAAEAEYTQYSIDFLSNGFQLKDGTSGYAQNTNGGKYIYMAFAADPDTDQATLARSFGIKTWEGNGSGLSVTGLGFEPGLIWGKARTSANSHSIFDTVRGINKELNSNSTDAQGSLDDGVLSFDSDGWTMGDRENLTQNNEDFVGWSWKADDNEPTIIGGPATLVYKFEDNANDVTGNYNGTANNITYATGKFNKAAQFNGSSSYIDTNFTLPAISSYSISFWFNTSSTVTWNDFLGDNPSNGSGLGARIILAIKNGTHFHVAISNGSSFWQDNSTVSASNYVDGEWHHYALAVNGTSVKLFVDGSLLHTYTSSVSAGTGGARSITLGRLGDYNGEYFTGKLDQFRFYSGTFEQDQVSNLYSETIGDNDDLDYGSPFTSIISANANAGFSIAKWTGNGSAGKIPHGLSAVPEMIITKRLTGASPWYTYNAYLNGGTNPAHYFINLNTNDAETSNGSSGGSLFNSTPPTSTIFNIGTSLSGSGDEYIAYCFHSVTGYSKFGSYTGNGGSNSITGLGFQPDFVMIKSTGSGSWGMYDSVRTVSIGDNAGTANARPYILANTNGKENGATSANVNLDSNGFSMNTSSGDLNTNGQTYIYMATKIN